MTFELVLQRSTDRLRQAQRLAAVAPRLGAAECFDISVGESADGSRVSLLAWLVKHVSLHARGVRRRARSRGFEPDVDVALNIGLDRPPLVRGDGARREKPLELR